ncbi:hypothetical protein [Halalkalibacterium ligniniphilum]|nr:hypothetical protein [Halalkalibacterium ligniniphilum]
MALTNLPTIKPSKPSTFLIGLSLATFIFFFTQPKQSDSNE